MADGNLYAEQSMAVGTSGPDVADALLDDERIAPLLDCLGDPAAAFALTTEQGTFAIAATVDSEGNGEAWSCIYSPGEAQAVADALEPQHEWVEIISTDVDGDVIRTELAVTGQDPWTSGEISLIQNAPESLLPGF